MDQFTPTLQVPVSLIDGEPRVSSRQVAEHFDKNHRDVLRALDSLECSEEFTLRNFAQGSYTHPNTGDQQHREVWMTKDGFTFLAMGFTGARAAVFKEAYIQAFNALLDRDQRYREQIAQLTEVVQHLTCEVSSMRTQALPTGADRSLSQGVRDRILNRLSKTAISHSVLLKRCKAPAFLFRNEIAALQEESLIHAIHIGAATYYCVPGKDAATSAHSRSVTPPPQPANPNLPSVPFMLDRE